jgi:hypothetical protein
LLTTAAQQVNTRVAWLISMVSLGALSDGICLLLESWAEPECMLCGGALLMVL